MLPVTAHAQFVLRRLRPVFSAETDCRALLDTDTEAIYLAGTTGYILLWRSET